MLEIALNLNKWTVICQKSCNFVAKRLQKIKMREFAGLFADFKSRQQYILKLKKT